MDAGASRATEDIVAIERGVEADGGEEVFVELGAENSQFVDGKVAQLDAFLERKADGIADFLVCGTERNALVNEISSGGHGVKEAILCGLGHAVTIEFNCGREARDEGEHGRDEFNGEGRLLRLLHVFIVGQRQAFELERYGLRSAMDAADLGADELGEIRIFLLRHGAGAGGKCFRQVDKSKLRRGEKRDLLRETAEMQTNECELVEVLEDEVAIAGGIDGIGGRRSETQLLGGKVAVERERGSGDSA